MSQQPSRRTLNKSVCDNAGALALAKYSENARVTKSSMSMTTFWQRVEYNLNAKWP